MSAALLVAEMVEHPDRPGCVGPLLPKALFLQWGVRSVPAGEGVARRTYERGNANGYAANPVCWPPAAMDRFREWAAAQEFDLRRPHEAILFAKPERGYGFFYLGDA